MSDTERYQLLDELLSPFGYRYVPSQDIVTTRLNAWQKEFGYCSLYDRTAHRFHMIFDCLPVYFDYRGRTWLLEFWKGQYGINTGAEIGLYYADCLLEDWELQHTLFKAVDHTDMVKMSLTLSKDNEPIAVLSGRHWWLTAFDVGLFSQPYELTLNASVTFPSTEMANAFSKELRKARASSMAFLSHFCQCCNTVNFSYRTTKGKSSWAQWMNHFWCRVYFYITRPFTLSVDRILFLYLYLPFAFRRAFRLRRYKPNRKEHL